MTGTLEYLTIGADRHVAGLDVLGAAGVNDSERLNVRAATGWTTHGHDQPFPPSD